MKDPELRSTGASMGLGTLLMVGLLFVLQPGAAGEQGKPDEPVLVGLVTREEIEIFMPEWVVAVVEAAPDVAVAQAMVEALPGSEIEVFFGTWCSDSGRELPRLWRALDDLGGLNPEEIRYVGVDRDKAEPAQWVAGSDLQRVPTFVVRRNGEELGRIVESSPHGIERDLLALLRGEVSGVITDSPDFLSEIERN